MNVLGQLIFKLHLSVEHLLSLQKQGISVLDLNYIKLNLNFVTLLI
jgi:hypothetical protein